MNERDFDTPTARRREEAIANAMPVASSRMHDLGDLIGSSEVARICGVTTAAVSNWLHRGHETRWKQQYHIPKPLVYVGGRPLFSRQEVIDFRTKYARKMSQEIDKQIAALEARRRKLEE